MTRPALVVLLAAALAGAFLEGCGRNDPPSVAGSARASGFRFTDVAAEAGITRVTLAGRPGKDHLLDSAGVGCAWIDYDRDGWIDAYVVNGWKLDGSRVLEKGRNALYRNRGDCTFEDVTDRAGVGGEGEWGSGVTVADYDGDGWPDILLTNFGKNVLYRNRGDGTFENVAAKAGIECPGWNTGAAFFDADGDGHLDLYIAAYIDCSLDDVLHAERTLDWKGVAKVAPGPFGLRGAADHFFRSDGHGHFVDGTAESGMTDVAQAFGFGVRAADFDGDGDLDVYVANDSDPNYLYRNDGHGHFEEVALWTGCALDQNGAAQAGMGVTVSDAKGDGRPDIFVTNFAEDVSTLYLAADGGVFRDATAASGVGPPTYTSMSWGTSFADLDCDGDPDLIVANGHIYPQVDQFPDKGQTYRQKLILLDNQGGAKFVDASGRGGPAFELKHSCRGLAVGDYDNDGDLDVLITVLDGPPLLLRNDSACGSWLTVICEVPPGQGPLIGTRVTVTAQGKAMIRDVTSSESFLSCPDPRLHFGLGAATVADRVVVRWPDGSETVREKVPARQFLPLKKGR